MMGCSKKNEAPQQLQLQACELVTNAEMEEILGQTLKEPEETEDPATCTYSALDETSFVSASILVSPLPSNTSPEEAYNQYVADLKENLGNEYTIDEIQGIGAKAGWSEEYPAQLTVFTDNVFFVVGVNPSKLSTLERNQAIAEKALARLE
jgi:hypothetical protein